MIDLREMMASLRRETATRAEIIRVVGWFYPVLLVALWLVARGLREAGHISPDQYRLLLRWNFLFALLLGLLIARLIRTAVEGVAAKFSTGGSAPHEAAFSLEDSLIARGDFQAARTTLEARLNGSREDPAVQVRLAELLADRLHDPEAAERWFLAARSQPLDDRQQARVANGLIDLYRATGQSGRLMVELARFASAYAGTSAGRHAERELRELKAGLGR